MAAIAGALVGLGLVLIAAGFIRPSDVPRERERFDWSWRRVAPITVGATVGALVLLSSGWPAAGLGAGALVGFVTAIVSKRDERPVVVEAKLEAIAAWCEQLRDLLRAGALLSSAIATTASTCPAAIRPAVLSLAVRLEHERPERALRRLADELNDPAGDLVASVLLTASTHAGNTAELLSDLADLTRQRVDRRKQIEAARASTRMDMRIIVSVCAATVVTMVLFARSEFLHPYRTAQGQAVLLSIFGLFVLAVRWARRLATYRQPARFLAMGTERSEP